MSIRMLWVMSPDAKVDEKLIYSRKFSTVDRRVQKLQGDHFVPLPDSEDFTENLLNRLGIQRSSEFVEWRDKANKQIQLPVVDVKTQDGFLWPVLVMEQHGILFSCLPEVDMPYSPINLPSLAKIPSVSHAFAVLQGIIAFLGSLPSSENELMKKLMDLDNYLSFSLPFGRPYESEPFIVNSLLSAKDLPAGGDTKLKMPGWKPVPFKGKSSVSFTISESVRCIQWDQPGFQGQCDVFGNIIVKAELEGAETDVSVVLHNSQSGLPLHIDSVLQHPCIRSMQLLTTGSPGARKLRFSPPLHSLVLCHYTGSSKLVPPILGVYKARGEKKMELLLQLKLSEGTLNNFTYCDVRLPFFNRGVIKNVVECKQTLGLLQMSDDKSTLVWKIGQKFPPKDLEVSLTATVIFEDSLQSSIKDSFCVGANCYVQVNFLMPNIALTGCLVDLKTLQVSPPYKVKSSAERELKSGEYKIWNSYGDVPYSPAETGNSCIT